MAGKWIRGGVPREFNFADRDWTPAEGETLTYMLSGRGGAVHIGGNSEAYQESNPFLGGINITVSVDHEDFKELVAAQSAGEKLNGYVVTAANETLNVVGGIANDGSLENDNGTVSLEIRGTVEAQ